MKKKLTITLALLTLSAALVGCKSKASPEAIVPEENIIVSEENTTETDEAVENELVEEETTTEEVENTKNPSEEAKEAEEKPEEATKAEETNKTEETNKVQTGSTQNNISSSNTNTSTAKPSPKPSTPATSKPSTNTSTSKPQTNTNTGSSSQGATTKPQVTPAPSPSPTPSAPAVPENTAPALSCDAIFNKITSNVELPSQVDMDATLLKDFYGIDANILEDFTVKMPLMSAHIAEIGVFKVKDVNNVSTIVDAINKRANDMGISLYPSLVETFENRQVVTKGKYILFAVCDDVDTLVANFNNLV